MHDPRGLQEMSVMNANAYEITMPSNYSEMDTNELEYDGGFNWGLALA